MEKSEFEQHFRCFKDDTGNSIGKGSLDTAFNEAEYHSFNSGMPMEVICSKWKAYIDECIANKTPDKYIKSMESFIKAGDYKKDYGASLRQLQPSFLDKYPKKKPVKEEEHPLFKFLKEQPDGPFTLDDPPEAIEKFKQFIKVNKLKLFQEPYQIVIKETDTGFIKISLWGTTYPMDALELK